MHSGFSSIVVLWLSRLFEGMFFAGTVGCVVTIVLSWYSIFKEELTSKQ